AAPGLARAAERAPPGAGLSRDLARRSEQGGDAAARRAAMLRVNPLYVLRNHLAQRAIEAAQRGDASEIDRLLVLLRDPYTERPGFESYACPPAAGEPAVAVSCSS